LSNQKEVVAKEGLGFTPKSKKKKKKKKKKKTKQPIPLKEVFVKAGEGAHEKKKDMGMGGNPKKGKTTPSNKASNFNPSYVLCRASDGHVYVLLMSTLNGPFGFLRPLLLTSKDPFKNGYLKPSIDLL
jgi:hypothetical protein